MLLRARIRNPKAAASNLGTPVACEIAAADGGGFYLFSLNASGKRIADTWHESIDSAKAQAEWQFQVREEDWQQMSES